MTIAGLRRWPRPRRQRQAIRGELACSAAPTARWGISRATRRKRVDPQAVLSGAKSIITLAVAYGEGGGATGLAAAATQVNGSPLHGPAGTRSIKRTTSPQPSPPLRGGEGEEPTSRGAASRSWAAEASEAGANFSGVVARYARHADYHAVIGEKLKALTEFVNHVGGDRMRSLWYVDTGPLLERDLAQRAGLGFIGKHTSLISREFGNWIFLAEIITTLELAPDEPEEEPLRVVRRRCDYGVSRAAITAPFELDARRCISYLTIELKGPIPEELRPGGGESDLRMRRLPGGVPLEPVCAREQSDEGTCAARPRLPCPAGIARAGRGRFQASVCRHADSAHEAARTAAQCLRGFGQCG